MASEGMGVQHVTSWTAEEHQQFVDALEATSSIRPEMTPTQTWQYLSDAVPSKTMQDVSRHALLYLHKLNMESEEQLRTSSSADTVVDSEEAAPDIMDVPQRKPVQPEPVNRSGSSSPPRSNGGRKRKGVASQKSDEWSAAEELHFEKLLLEIDPVCKDRWEQMASQIGSKTAEQVHQHYRHIREQIKQRGKGGAKKAKGSKSEGKAAKARGRIQTHGQSWSEEEHRRFLEGLERFGKGDWRNIARQSVITRTPTQVASHAQKFFLRQQAGPPKVPDPQGRQSIHDITTDAVREIIENEQQEGATQKLAAAPKRQDGKRKEPPAAASAPVVTGSASKRRRGSTLATVAEGEWEAEGEDVLGVCAMAPLSSSLYSGA
jgi:SHAQKYF class myb-like DNA-binding protein